LNSAHGEFKNKIFFFKRKSAELNDDILKTAFDITVFIARNKKTCTIEEHRVSPAAMKIYKIIHSSESSVPLKTIPVSVE
jgi:hypothetical protein